MTSNQDFQMTREEVDRFEKAMREPEFRKLLGDYIDEISDPKNKAEYDQYLKEMEDKRELPKGMKLMEPKPGFCIKTLIKNKKKPQNEQKLFINVCSAYDVERPSSKKDKKHTGGQRGQQWSVPHSTGVLRYDQDKNKQMCHVIDIIFNPLVFEFSAKQESFQKMVCDISLQAASHRMKEADDTISQDYKILKNTKCYGGKPAVIPIRIDQEFKPNDGKQPQRGPDVERVRNEDAAPKLYQEFMKQQAEHKMKDVQEKAKNSRIQELASHEFETIKEGEEEEVEEKQPKGPSSISRPKYEIVHSFGVDLGNFICNGPVDDNRRPKEITIKIHIPRVEKMKEVDLDVNEKTLVLKAEKKYYLDLELPFKVNSDDGSAKFDSKQRILKVTLPVAKEEKQPQKNGKENAGPVEDEIEEIKAPQKQNDEAEQEVEENGDSALKFASEEAAKKQEQEQLKHIESLNKENDNKNMVEVIQEETFTKKNGDAKIQSEEAPKPKPQKVVNTKFEFKNQEIEDKFFLIFNVSEYVKENCEVGFTDNEVLFSYNDDKRQLISHIVFKDKKLNRKESIVNFVTDYIVINVNKETEGYWEAKSYEVKEYEPSDFNQKMDLYKDDLKVWEAEKASEIKEISMKKDENNNESEEKPQQEQPQSQEQEKQPEEEADEEKSEAGELIQEQKLENRIDKRSINFIQYKRDTFAFELD